MADVLSAAEPCRGTKPQQAVAVAAIREAALPLGARAPATGSGSPPTIDGEALPAARPRTEWAPLRFRPARPISVA
jgi:hypothetical protein